MVICNLAEENSWEAINLNIAKTFGLAVPDKLLVAADEVIE